MGLLRLRRVTFAGMPMWIATAIAIIGVFVVAFSVYVWRAKEPLGGRQPIMTLRAEPHASAPPETGDVRLSVRTTTGEPAPDIAVELQSGFTGEGKKLSGLTDDSGRFTFTGLDINPGAPWIAVATYEGADFASELLREPGDVTIRIAHTTKSDGGLSVDVSSLALVGDERGMQALQVVSMRNSSSDASVAGVVLPVLRGGTQLEPGSGLDRASLLIDRNGNIVSIAPLLPGRSQFTYTYLAEMERRGRSVSLRAPYRTGRFDLLLGGKLAFRPGAGMHRRGSVTLGGRTYRRFTAENVRKGQRLRGTVVLASGSKIVTIAPVVAAALIALAILVLPLLRRRRRTPEGEAAGEREPQPEWT